MRRNPPADWLIPKSAEPTTQKPYKPRLLKPRLPTEQEKQELLDYCVRESGDTTQENRSNLEWMLFGGESPIVVFDDVAIYYGEYTGRLLVIVGDVDPTITETYLWLDGKIQNASLLKQRKLHKASSK